MYTVAQTPEVSLSITKSAVGDYVVNVKWHVTHYQASAEARHLLTKWYQQVVAKNARQSFYLPSYGCFVTGATLYKTLATGVYGLVLDVKTAVKRFCADLRKEDTTRAQLLHDVQACIRADENVWLPDSLTEAATEYLINFEMAATAQYLLHRAKQANLRLTAAQMRDLQACCAYHYTLIKFAKPTLQVGLAPVFERELMAASYNPYHYQAMCRAIANNGYNNLL